jgi:hypothetical protein
MSDADKIVAAIFAAGMCNKKVKATPADYLQAYDEMLAKIKEHNKPKPLNVTDQMFDDAERVGRRKRP